MVARARTATTISARGDFHRGDDKAGAGEGGHGNDMGSAGEFSCGNEPTGAGRPKGKK